MDKKEFIKQLNQIDKETLIEYIVETEIISDYYYEETINELKDWI